jgi:serine/threonine-protein phosphatase PP1-1
MRVTRYFKPLFYILVRPTNKAQFHFPEKSVVTVWSAPNYCYRCGNVASIMTVDTNLNTKFSIFSAVPDDQRHVPAGRRGPGDYFL